MKSRRTLPHKHVPSPRLPVIAAAAVLAALSPASAQDTAAQATLPGGASALTEQHGDWTVACSVNDEGKRCSLSQELVAAQTGQRVLSLELAPAEAGGFEGIFVTPFSLRLDAGVRLAIDDAALGDPLPFLTCIEVGCLVPVAFEGQRLDALRAGSQLQITAIALSNAQPITLSLPSPASPPR
jgi:invasion protein IalB